MTPGAAPLGMVRKRQVSGQTRAAVLLVHGFGQNRYVWHCTKRSFSTYLAAEGSMSLTPTCADMAVRVGLLRRGQRS